MTEELRNNAYDIDNCVRGETCLMKIPSILDILDETHWIHLYIDRLTR